MKFGGFKNKFKNFLKHFQRGPLYLVFLLKNDKLYFHIYTYMKKIERLLLYKLDLSLKKISKIVEIGSYLGASSSFLACAAKEKNHTVYCIDTWKSEGMSEGERDTFNEFCRNIEQLKKYVRIFRGKSVDIANTFDKKIDLLFIDGDHSYGAVKADAVNWIPKVKEGGIVIFHDIGWAEGVKRVVKEEIKHIQTEEHIVDNTYWAKIRKNG